MCLTLAHLSKTFPERGQVGEVRAVDNVSLAMARGEFVTLLGPSGCGKTTTLRLLAGFESPTQGHMTLDGRCLDDVPPNRRNMAMVLQRHGDGYAGRVRRTAYPGPMVEYEVEVTGTVLSLTQYDPRQVYAIGTEGRVQLVTDAVYLLPEEAESEGWQP